MLFVQTWMPAGMGNSVSRWNAPDIQIRRCFILVTDITNYSHRMQEDGNRNWKI